MLMNSNTFIWSSIVYIHRTMSNTFSKLNEKIHQTRRLWNRKAITFKFKSNLKKNTLRQVVAWNLSGLSNRFPRTITMRRTGLAHKQIPDGLLENVQKILKKVIIKFLSAFKFVFTTLTALVWGYFEYLSKIALKSHLKISVRYILI